MSKLQSKEAKIIKSAAAIVDAVKGDREKRVSPALSNEDERLLAIANELTDIAITALSQRNPQAQTESRVSLSPKQLNENFHELRTLLSTLGAPLDTLLRILAEHRMWLVETDPKYAPQTPESSEPDPT